ncbi:MAG: DUF933 domain-containing protein [Firmicutes bacterium]|nr:DUF933 domain-containing protein [Bacillota bacterium]
MILKFFNDKKSIAKREIVRIDGKKYAFQDGDVVLISFNL